MISVALDSSQRKQTNKKIQLESFLFLKETNQGIICPQAHIDSPDARLQGGGCHTLDSMKDRFGFAVARWLLRASLPA